MKTLYETARDSLIVIESIASGSTTTNSLPHLARLAREGLTAIESADRAQQGEPVDERDESSVFLATTRGGDTCYFGFHSFAAGWAGEDGSVKEIKLPVRDFSVVEESVAATKAAAPADVSVISYGNPVDNFTAPVPDTGIPAAGSPLEAKAGEGA